jgi:hypothetical protein
MADTVTTNYHWVKPEISGSPTTWGVKLNADLDQIDALVFANQGAANAAQATATSALPLAGGIMTGPIVATAISVSAAPVAPNDVVRLADMPASPTAPVLVPIGGMVMWPSAAPPPINWLICNGATYSTTTYPALAAALGTLWGPAGTLPDFTISAPMGPDPSNEFASPVGNSFGIKLAIGSDYWFNIVNFIIRAA